MPPRIKSIKDYALQRKDAHSDAENEKDAHSDAELREAAVNGRLMGIESLCKFMAQRGARHGANLSKFRLPSSTELSSGALDPENILDMQKA